MGHRIPTFVLSDDSIFSGHPFNFDQRPCVPRSMQNAMDDHVGCMGHPAPSDVNLLVLTRSVDPPHPPASGNAVQVSALTKDGSIPLKVAFNQSGDSSSLTAVILMTIIKAASSGRVRQHRKGGHNLEQGSPF